MGVVDWDKIINYGVPLLLLAWIVYFGSKHVWPFVVARIEKNDQERKEERREFLTALSEIKATLQANTQATLDVLQEVRSGPRPQRSSRGQRE